jgi:hypothetical protein
VKVIIAGSRGIQDRKAVEEAIEQSNFVIDEVVCGMSYGVDAVAKEWAEEHEIPLVPFYARWNTEGRAAGPKRNARMAEYADALIAIWDGKSRGTKSMIEEAKKKRLHVFVYEPELDDTYVEQPTRLDT